ncbi:MAG TPA: hypothetical protein PLR51_04320 [Methanomassiliicoccales archaeon]|nr:hypothetical protein [Methanomassiliicoccales archaeon]HQQ25488.1 hypothetical protein [Methanomassiliicoccales archaeon]
MLESAWKKEAEKDKLNDAERALQLVSWIFTAIAAWFLLAHWTGDTGFYTSEFGQLDALVLFGPLLFGLLPPLVRTLRGRKSVSRPWDIFGSLLFVLSSAYFLCAFPFDMGFFAVPLPEGMRSLVDWVTEDIAKVVLAIGAVGGTFGIGWTTLTYFKVKEILENRTKR